MEKSLLKIRFVKLNDFGNHLLIRVKVNDKPATILIDTGASNTVFDKARIEKFLGVSRFRVNKRKSTGLGTSSMESHEISLARFELGTLLLTDYYTIALDLSHVNTSYKKMKLKPIDGVLGSDLLRRFNGVIDYKKKTLTLDHPSSGTGRKKKSGSGIGIK
jgi:hypothetical protein